MDLGLDLNRTVGRPARKLLVEVVRDLRQEDLILLSLERGVKPPSLKALRDSHHSIARCIAEGKNGVETQLITGYSASRISILKGDPSFQELVAFYKTKVEEIKDQAFIDAQAKLAALNSDAIDELADRLNDKPEGFANDELLDLVKLASDRTGLGPQSKSTNVNVNVDLAARVSAGRARVARLQITPRLVGAPAEGETVSGRTPPSPPPEDVIEAEIIEGGEDGDSHN